MRWLRPILPLVIGALCASALPTLPANAEVPSALRILAVGSDTYVAGTTVADPRVGGLIDVVATADATKAMAFLDGRPLDPRALAVVGQEARTQFRVQPRPGRHVFTAAIENAAGARQTTTYEFSVAEFGTHGARLAAPTGEAISGATVLIYTRDGNGGRTQVATATTDGEGFWTVPDVALSNAHTRAKDNDGVLNLEAVYSGTATTSKGSFPVFGLTTFSIGTGQAATSRASSATEVRPIQDLAVRIAGQARPASRAAAAVTGPEGPDSGPLAAQVNDMRGAAQSARGSRDEADLLAGATYKNAPGTGTGGVRAGEPAIGPLAAGDLDGCYYSGQGTKKLVGSYTIYSRVLEGHSSNNSYASAKYGTTAGTAFSSGISYDHGSTWSISGESYEGDSLGGTLGYSKKGPYYARELLAPFKWKIYDYWVCGLVNGHYQAVKYQATAAQEVSFGPASGDPLWKAGDDVSGADDYYHWKDAPYRYTLPPNSFWDITTSKYKKYTVSGSVKGFKFSAETSLSTTRTQGITAGSSKVITHWIFGYQPIGEGMKVFYAY